MSQRLADWTAAWHNAEAADIAVVILVAMAFGWVLVEWGWNAYHDWRERRAVAKERSAYGTAAVARRESRASMARTRREDRRPLDQRVADDLARRGQATVTLGEVQRFNHDERTDWPLSQSHPRQKRTADSVESSGLTEESGYSTTRLTFTPHDDAA